MKKYFRFLNIKFYIITVSILLTSCSNNSTMNQQDTNLRQHHKKIIIADNLDLFASNFATYIPGAKLNKYDNEQLFDIQLDSSYRDKNQFHDLQEINNEAFKRICGNLSKTDGYLTYTSLFRDQHRFVKTEGGVEISVNSLTKNPLTIRHKENLHFLKGVPTWLCSDYSDYNSIPGYNVFKPYFMIQYLSERAHNSNARLFHLLIYKPEAINKYFLLDDIESEKISLARKEELSKNTIHNAVFKSKNVTLKLFARERDRSIGLYRISILFENTMKKPFSFRIDSIQSIFKNGIEYSVAWYLNSDTIDLHPTHCTVIEKNRVAIINPGDSCAVDMPVKINSLEFDTANYGIKIQDVRYPMELIMKSN